MSRRRRYLDNTAPADNTANVVRPVNRMIQVKQQDTPARREKETKEYRARQERAKYTPVNPRQASIGPYREKTALDKAGGRLYAEAEQRRKDAEAKREAAVVLGALVRPISPSSMTDIYDAYIRNQVHTISDALAAPYLSNSWSQQHPSGAALYDIVGGIDILGAPLAIRQLRYAFPKVISSSRGLPNTITNNLMHNTIGRNKLALQAVSPTNRYNTKLLLDKLNEIKVQHISNGGLGPNTLGDFTPNLNRIRYITNDAENTLLHEGRHAIDRHGIPLTSEQDEILNAAYGNDFVGLPFSPYARRSIKNYYGMGKEKTTTNFDARRLLLGDNDKLSISKQNKILDKLDDSAIIYGVENANGYGGNYIEFLRKTGQLTKDKINAFRQAMKYVGGVVMPIGVGYNVYKNQ